MRISRAALPRGFAVDSAESTVAAYATLDWGILQALWAQRFPGFGKPLAPSDKSSTSNPSTQVSDHYALALRLRSSCTRWLW